MIINGEREKPKTIITILEEDQEEEEPTRLEEEPRRSLKEEPRRSPKGIEIVKKGNRYVVKKRKAKWTKLTLFCLFLRSFQMITVKHFDSMVNGNCIRID